MDEYIVRVDKISPTLSYAGKALPGSLTSAAVWRIAKIEVIANEIVLLWADSNALFDNIWDDRLILSY